MKVRLVAAAISLALSTTSCRVVAVAQVPADGRPFEAVRLSETYALTRDEAGRPLGLWDLGYPVARREGDEDRERFPVRLVHFGRPDEEDSRRRHELWSYGYRSFFGGLVTLNVLKWYQTTDLFAVREVRTARRAMLHEWLSSAGDELARHGVHGATLTNALEQVREDEGEPVSPPEIESIFRHEYRARAERIHGGASKPHIDLGAPIDFVPFGGDAALVLVKARPIALVDTISGYVLWLDEAPVDECSLSDLSLEANTGGSAVITGASIAAAFPIGIPINLVTSVVPVAPFRSEDADYGARGRLLARVSGPAPAPSELVPYRTSVLQALEQELRRGNPYWPTTPNALAESNWIWLLQRSEALGISRISERGSRAAALR